MWIPPGIYPFLPYFVSCLPLIHPFFHLLFLLLLAPALAYLQVRHVQASDTVTVCGRGSKMAAGRALCKLLYNHLRQWNCCSIIISPVKSDWAASVVQLTLILLTCIFLQADYFYVSIYTALKITVHYYIHVCF